MATTEELQEALRSLVQAVRGREARAGRDWLAWLLDRSGNEWLSLDGLARGRGWGKAIVVGAGWAERSMSGRPDLLADVVVSWHADGRLRERAVDRLASHRDRTSAAALATRCLDHVPQVSKKALRRLLLQTASEAVDAVISVLTAGSARSGAQAALTAYTDELLTAPGGVEKLLRHARHADRGVSRWVVAVALERRLLTPEQVLELSRTHVDQLVRVRCAEWLAAESPEILSRLLDSRFVDSRLAALQQLPDRDLPIAQLRAALLDRSSRIRAVAQGRSRDRGLDASDIYRAQLDSGASRRTAVALAGLASVSSTQDVPLVVRFLAHEQPAVRAAAVGALVALATADDAIPLATPLLLDRSTKVVAAATRALIRADAGVAIAAAAWEHPQVFSRGAAWRVSRAAGGWDRIVSDLRAANDRDLVLAQNGRAGVKTWLAFGAASTWQQPTSAQQALIADLLTGSGIGKKASRQVAFHAEVTWTPPTIDPATQQDQPDRVTPPRWWQRLAGRRTRTRPNNSA